MKKWLVHLELFKRSSFAFSFQPPGFLARLSSWEDGTVHVVVDLPAPAYACAIAALASPQRLGRMVLGAMTLRVNERTLGAAVAFEAVADVVRTTKLRFKK